MIATALFYVALALLFTHEMDAVEHSEWQVLFMLRSMPREAAYPWFVALHVPLYAGMLWLSHHARPVVRDRARLAISAFLVVHAGLHFRLRDAPAYEFEGALSNALIAGAAVFGAGYLVASRFQAQASR